MFKKRIREKIFELLKQVSGGKHKGLLIVFSDLKNVLARGAAPLGIQGRTLKAFSDVCNIEEDNAEKILKKVGDDGAILIDKKGTIYSPAVYLNVNLFSIDEEEIEPEFCARHISALATSASTKSYVFTLSEETNKIREFYKGKTKRKYPGKEQEKILKTIKKDLKNEKAEIKKNQ